MKKRPPTNWRKRALEAEAARTRDNNFWEELYDTTTSGLQHQIEVGDQLLAAQRERLIRLTEISDLASTLVGVIGGSWHMAGSETFELDGTKWIRHREAARVSVHAHQVLTAIAALSVDTACPPKETL
jgi:hypothetical protein